MNADTPPALPYPDFPLRTHRNGSWYRSVWNRQAKKSEQFYFGSWRDDPKGERAMTDPAIGWLARRDAIRAGIDNVRVELIPSAMTLGELMSRFLAHKLRASKSGDLSNATLDGYLREVHRFVMFMKPATPPGRLLPEHFTAYMKHMIEERRLGRFARKRVRTYVTTFLRFGAKNDWFQMPNTGVDWVVPATDPDSMRLARARAGVRDYSERIVTGDEIDKLLSRSQPAFKAMILLGINCGLGPSDIGHLRWHMIDLDSGRLVFPRPKTGVRRAGFLWNKTRDALRRVRTLKHNRIALAEHGEDALVFITRKGLSYSRDREVYLDLEINGKKTRKLVGIAAHNPIGRTFGRMVRQLGLEGVSFYRLRHTFKTLGKKARDAEALDLAMGHKNASIGKMYDHTHVSWRRMRRLSRIVRRQLWPRVRRKVDMSPQQPSEIASDGDGTTVG